MLRKANTSDCVWPLSDYSAYINGEVITIDGGEWLRNGGEFSHLEMVPAEMWDMQEKMRGK